MRVYLYQTYLSRKKEYHNFAMNEATLKATLLEGLSEDFKILEEVGGSNLIEGKHVRIDLLLYPKPHLVARGFDPGWFGIEVKDIDFLRPHASQKTRRLFWQSITYAQSMFKVDRKEKIRPNFVLVYVDEEPTDRSYWRELLSFGQYANVGQLYLDSYLGWGIKFGGGGYYSKKYGRSRIKNLGTKRYVGSIA